MTWLVDALAVARLTRLATRDSITHPLRRAAIVRSDLADDLLSCPWCVSIWMAGAVITARVTVPRLWSPVAQLLAASEIAGLIVGPPPVEQPRAYETVV